MANADIKEYAKKKSVHLWLVGEKMGFVHDSAFSRKLRHELSKEEKAKIKGIIDDLASSKG